MRTLRLRTLRLAVAASAVGLTYQLGGCSISGIKHYVGSFNPCGTILNCDPVTYRFITSGYEGPGADPNVDPICTYPPFCPDDPFVATVAP